MEEQHIEIPSFLLRLPAEDRSQAAHYAHRIARAKGAHYADPQAIASDKPIGILYGEYVAIIDRRWLQQGPRDGQSDMGPLWVRYSRIYWLTVNDPWLACDYLQLVREYYEFPHEQRLRIQAAKRARFTLQQAGLYE